MITSYIRFITLLSVFFVFGAIALAGIPIVSDEYSFGHTNFISPDPTAQGGVTDANIAAIVVTANKIDIDAGKMAQSKSTNPKVKSFAEQMIKDHTSVNKAATDLVTRLGVTPEESDTSRGLKASADETSTRLNGLSGADFDKAYIDNEVAYHKLVLDAVDKTLIPNAKNAELKATLIKVRPLFAAHLQHAQHLQASMGGSVRGAQTRMTRKSKKTHSMRRSGR